MRTKGAKPRKHSKTDQRSEVPCFVKRLTPKSDESFLGFLLRLAEANFYDSPRIILNVARFPQKTFGGRFPHELTSSTVARFAELSKLSVEDVRPLLYQRIEPETFKVRGHLLQGRLFRLNRPQVCPACLRMSNHCRMPWDFAFVTACPIHLCRLLESCPNCDQPIQWNRKAVSICRCDYDWRTIETKRFPLSETLLPKLIYQHLGIMSTKLEPCNPLYSLDLPSVLKGLILIGRYDTNRRTKRDKLVLSAKTTAESHARLSAAFLVFENWPTNFFTFLDRIRADSISSRSNSGLNGTFGDFYRNLYDRPREDDALMDLIRENFERYASENMDDAMRLFVAEVGRQVSKVAFLPYLSLEETAKVLGLTRPDVLKLVESSLLKPILRPSLDNGSWWKFNKLDVQNLLNCAILKARSVQGIHRNRLRTFDNVLKTINKKLSVYGDGVDTFIRDIFDGRIIPQGESTNAVGFSRFTFLRSEVNAYIKDRLTNSTDDQVYVTPRSRQFGIRPDVLRFLAQRGLVRTDIETCNGVSRKTVTLEAVRLFNSKYVSDFQIAREIDQPTGYLRRELARMKIKPVSGPSVDYGPQYIFSRADIPNVKLAKLRTSCLKRKRKVRQSSSVDLVEAARILSVKKQTIIQLVKDGVLSPYFDSRKSPGSYQFSRLNLEHRRSQIKASSNLISCRIANKLLGEHGVSRFVKMGYLKYRFAADRRMRFVDKAKVEALVSLKSDVATCVQAAQLLGVTPDYIMRWADQGLLQPLDNPFTRAYRGRMYSRAYLATLQVIKLPAYHRTGGPGKIPVPVS